MSEALRFHGLIGGKGKSIKSIQAIEVSYSNRTSMDIAISSVDVSKTIVLMFFNSAVSNIAYCTNVELTNSTNIRLSSYSPDPNNIMGITLYVVEFENVKSKQAGTFTGDGTTYAGANFNVTIGNVDPTKCIAFASYSCSSGAQGTNNTAAKVTSNTNLNVKSWNGTGNYGTLKWQVLELL